MQGKGLVVGTVLGVVIASAVPVTAHHRRDTSRVERRLLQLESQVADLTDRTQQLDPEGFYTGPIYSLQVFHEFCGRSDDAIFVGEEGGPGQLTCTEGPYPAP